MINENIQCPYCKYEHCDLRDNEVPSLNFKCDNCGKVFEVAEITKVFYETKKGKIDDVLS